MTGWLWVILIGIALIPFFRDRWRKPVGRRMRKSAPGSFAKLKSGTTHYRWLGRVRGPVLVCVHGLTTPSFVWDRLAPLLGNLGFRVLVYDLYGRGFSDRSRRAQTPEFFANQLEELLDHLEIRNDITLLGYSMGGVIASRFAVAHPDRLRQLVLLAPAGMLINFHPVIAWAMNWPFVGDWLFQMVFPNAFFKATEAERAKHPEVGDIIDQQQGELHRRGFLRAVLSSLRGSLRKPGPKLFKALAKLPLPVYAIWARDDQTIPIDALGQLAQWHREAVHEVIDGAGHGVPYTHPAEVAEVLATLLDLSDE